MNIDGRNRDSVQVRCPDAGWRIYVAVAQSQTPQAGEPGGGEIVVKKGETVSIIVEGGHLGAAPLRGRRRRRPFDGFRR